MELFIEMRNGAPYGHPILDSNFREVYPDIDTQNLPSNFARFVRTAPPSNVGMFEVEESTYQIVGDVVTDVWAIRPLEGEQYAMRVDMLRQSLEGDVENQKLIAQEKIAEATDPAVKAAWEDYLAIMTAMVITDPVVQQYQMPMQPRVTEDGLVYTTSSSGSAPNVIE
jgi:hypothetical protein